MTKEIFVRTAFPRRVREIRNCWIPMPDGVKLAARIWLPEDASADPVPAILEYLPYRKGDGTAERDHLTHPYFAGHGYAGVRVDLRGTGDSEGVCLGEYLKQEQDDALAVIEWLAAQEWCSGKVGMIGISWGGFNGLQVAARRPPALGAVISLCSTDDRYADDIHCMGGCILTDKLAWGATAFSIANTPPDPEIVGDRWRDLWLQRLRHNGLWMSDWFRHQRRDSFYAHGSVCENYADIEVPIYMVGGWADGYTNAVLRVIEHLPGPKKGLVGPWAHKYPHFAKPGPRIGFLQECLRWWDQHLKGIDTGIMREPVLRAWIQEPAPPASFREHREGRWVAEAAWQGRAREVMPLFPGELGLTVSDQGGGIVVASPQNAGWTAGSWCGYGMVADAALDQNGEAGLMVSFESEPLAEDIELLGFPALETEVTSDTPQANLVAILSAVDGEGRASLFSYGMLNLTHRESHASPEPMPRGEARRVTVQLNACGQRIVKGQRIRLSLSTAYWPVIWPSQAKATLRLSGTRLDLPVRKARSDAEELRAFEPAESTAPMTTEPVSDANFTRCRRIDLVTGMEVYERISDSGGEIHTDTGMAVRDRSVESFSVHPDDANSAIGSTYWRKSYRRAGWEAEVETRIVVRALAGHWRIEASLTARDAEGLVETRNWREDIARDLV
ncbi:MAG: CocE/NonD family hydrolase [Rhodobacteraceae bacterium]|nr:CocE/NonD family hydrolase [Paracoccaceae bacterium]